jgi:nicotinate-nucleotide pyrophosphorylase (carboxylating)
LIHEAFLEDVPGDDITTKSLGMPSFIGTARIMAKEDLVVSGAEVFSRCVRARDPGADLKWYFANGQIALNGQTVCTIRGDLIQLLTAERVALNFLGRLSGIATLTRCYVRELEGSRTRVLHTRKTTPLLRDLEIQAVLDGGGHRHRRHLSDAFLIKENHIAVAGSLRQAVLGARSSGQGPVEVEVRTAEELREAVAVRPDRILLDNFTDDELRTLVPLIPPPIEIEASGNMSLERLRAVADAGVHFISVGRLTHSAPTADLSLIFDWKKA